MNAIGTARELLLKVLEPLEIITADLKEQLDEAEQSKARIEAALKELGGNSKTNRKSKKRCAKQSDVMAACKRLIEDNSYLSKEDLKGLVKQELKEGEGFSLGGFQLRFKECLASGTFAVAADGTVSMEGSTQRLPVEHLPESEFAG